MEVPDFAFLRDNNSVSLIDIKNKDGYILLNEKDYEDIGHTNHMLVGISNSKKSVEITILKSSYV